VTVELWARVIEGRFSAGLEPMYIPISRPVSYYNMNVRIT